MYAFGKYGAPLSSCWVVSGCYRQRGRLRTTAAAAEEESEDFFYFLFYEFLKIYAQLKNLHFYIAQVMNWRQVHHGNRWFIRRNFSSLDSSL